MKRSRPGVQITKTNAKKHSPQKKTVESQQSCLHPSSILTYPSIFKPVSRLMSTNQNANHMAFLAVPGLITCVIAPLYACAFQAAFLATRSPIVVCLL